jgi:hypothetical protein
MVQPTTSGTNSTQGQESLQDPKPSFIEQKIGEFLRSITIGVGFGILQYSITALVRKVSVWRGNVPFPLGPTLKLCVISGVAVNLIIFVVELVYEIAIRLLGERQENIQLFKEPTLLDRFRCYSWTVISKIEKKVQSMDQSFSKFFEIRSVSQISEEKTRIGQIPYLEVVEAVRHFCPDELRRFFTRAVPALIALSFVQAAGYPMLIEFKTMLSLQVAMIFICTSMKVNMLFLTQGDKDAQELLGIT